MGAGARASFTGLTYDGVGDRTGMTTAIPAFGSIPAIAGSTAETYDYGMTGGANAPLRRGYLTQEAFTPSGGSASTLSFGYDGHSPSSLPTNPANDPGNPTVMRGASHSYNSDNQDTGSAYDGDGNPTTYGGNALTFDAEDRMTAYGSSLTCGYDGDDGLRAWKQNAAGTRTYFLYDGDAPVCELSSSGSVTAYNFWGPTGLLSRNTGGSSTGSVYYAFDPSGNLAQRMDTEANVLASVRLDAFGSKSGTDASPDPYSGFGAEAGYYTDSEAGLELLGHRFYDPAAGRFINRDPSGYNGGVNLYGYVGNSPNERMDRSGFGAEDDDDDEDSSQIETAQGIKFFVEGLVNGIKTIVRWVGNLGKGGPPVEEGSGPGIPGVGSSSGGESGGTPTTGGDGAAGPKTCPTDLHAFGGGRSGPPRGPRPGIDVFPDDNGLLPGQTANPANGIWPNGQSMFGDPANAPLSGHYHTLPAGTPLPPGIDIVPDGSDVGGPNPSTHHTYYPTSPTTLPDLQDGWANLPWEYGGKK